jgi:dephospho-CoA kinase
MGGVPHLTNLPSHQQAPGAVGEDAKNPSAEVGGGAPSHLIGLTGGIATGKSTVSCYLKNQYQLTVLDADGYAREALAAGTPAYHAILNRYGSALKKADGSLDRSRLGALIFANPQEKAWLESQIHPWVRHCLQTAIAASEQPILILDIPLLFEAGFTDLVTSIWVVFCSDEQQLKRLMERNHLSAQEARQRIANQWPLTAKVARADFVLDNSQDLPFLYRQVDQVVACQLAMTGAIGEDRSP